MCPPRFHMPPHVPCSCVYVHEHVSSRPMCMCARQCSCTRCPHPPPPSVSCADDIGAEESDDKCPLSANEADDKWAGGRAAPLRCNNRRWMAWRPPPNPYPPAPVTGADQALPTREGAEPPAWPTKAGLRCPGLRAESPSSHPQ